MNGEDSIFLFGEGFHGTSTFSPSNDVFTASGSTSDVSTVPCKSSIEPTEPTRMPAQKYRSLRLCEMLQDAKPTVSAIANSSGLGASSD